MANTEMEFIEILREIPLEIAFEIVQREAERVAVSLSSACPESPAFEPE